MISKELIERLDTIYETKSPRTDIYETRESYTLFISMPGIELEDIDYNFDETVLTVTGKTSNNRLDERKLVYGEFKPTSYKRTFKFARAVDQENLSLEYVNGVLTIVLTKA